MYQQVVNCFLGNSCRQTRCGCTVCFFEGMFKTDVFTGVLEILILRFWILKHNEAEDLRKSMANEKVTWKGNLWKGPFSRTLRVSMLCIKSIQITRPYSQKGMSLISGNCGLVNYYKLVSWFWGPMETNTWELYISLDRMFFCQRSCFSHSDVFLNMFDTDGWPQYSRGPVAWTGAWSEAILRSQVLFHQQLSKEKMEGCGLDTCKYVGPFCWCFFSWPRFVLWINSSFWRSIIWTQCLEGTDFFREIVPCKVGNFQYDRGKIAVTVDGSEFRRSPVELRS